MRPDVIIPAHNEESTVADVVAAARQSRAVRQIVVVSDASTDRTWGQSLGADVVVRTEAGDKGSAIAVGLDYTDTPQVVMLDADLEGLLPEHVYLLATYGPEDGQVVGVRGNKGWTGNLPSLSGERRVPRAVLESVHPEGAGWTLETRLNARVGKLGLPWRHLWLKGVVNPPHAGKDPLGFVTEVAVVGASTIAHLPDLIAYSAHPDGRLGKNPPPVPG